MLNKLRQSNNKGFTIIEVMIVLAIAGMIILVVLLAVPAVQRSGRNSAIKNDAGAVAAGISEFSSNNNGAVPVTITVNAGTVTYTNGNLTSTAKVQGATAVSSLPANAASPAPITAAGTIKVWIGHSCAGTPSTRANAIFYATEGSGPLVQQCQDA